MLNPEEVIEKIDTVENLLDLLEEDLMGCKESVSQTEVFDRYRRLLIGQYKEDDVPELAMNIIVSPLKKKLWQTYENDLFKAELCLNKVGVETRYGDGMDRFRPMNKIMDDVARVYGVEVDSQNKDEE